MAMPATADSIFDFSVIFHNSRSFSMA